VSSSGFKKKKKNLPPKVNQA